MTTEQSHPSERKSHGFLRTKCACDFCQAYCRFVPGRLEPADLDKLCPPGADLFRWAEEHLRAIVDQPYPKLIPAQQENGHCHWLYEGRCAVHENAPYGCAFFDSHMHAAEVERRGRAVTRACLEDEAKRGLYYRVWRHLIDKGLTTASGDRRPLEAEMRRLAGRR